MYTIMNCKQPLSSVLSLKAGGKKQLLDSTDGLHDSTFPLGVSYLFSASFSWPRRSTLCFPGDSVRTEVREEHRPGQGHNGLFFGGTGSAIVRERVVENGC